MNQIFTFAEKKKRANDMDKSTDPEHSLAMWMDNVNWTINMYEDSVDKTLFLQMNVHNSSLGTIITQTMSL